MKREEYNVRYRKEGDNLVVTVRNEKLACLIKVPTSKDFSINKVKVEPLIPCVTIPKEVILAIINSVSKK